jgi:hypothetical protein
MNLQVMKWGVDLAMGVVFLFSGVTGILKFLVLLHVPVVSGSILPMAQISDVHDRAGTFLCLLVAVHLYLNRRWILSMTRKVLSGTTGIP